MLCSYLNNRLDFAHLTAYLLLIVPLVAIILPAQPCRSLRSSEHVALVTRLWEQIILRYRELALLLFTFAVVYTLSMPVILTNFGLHSYLGVFAHFAHARWVVVFCISAARFPRSTSLGTTSIAIYSFNSHSSITYFS